MRTIAVALLVSLLAIPRPAFADDDRLRSTKTLDQWVAEIKSGKGNVLRAGQMLGKFGEAAVEPAIGLMKDERAFVKQAALAALLEAGGPADRLLEAAKAALEKQQAKPL